MILPTTVGPCRSIDDGKKLYQRRAKCVTKRLAHQDLLKEDEKLSKSVPHLSEVNNRIFKEGRALLRD